MKKAFKTIAVLLVFSLVGLEVNAQSTDEKVEGILFTNVNVFDGVSDQLHRDMHVLVTGNKISEVSSEPLMIIQSTNMQTIDGEGMTLMPGLIDSHTHLYATSVFQTFAGLQAAKWDQIGAMANENARDYLYDG